MDPQQETAKTIRGRLEVLRKGLVSEKNSVEYYLTLSKKVPDDSEENIGMCRMYDELRKEEEKHVQTFESLIQHWEDKLKELES